MKVLDVVEDGSQVFLVLDYVHGETLHHLLRVAGTLSLSVVAHKRKGCGQSLPFASRAIPTATSMLG